ncbi:glutathione-dependent formaldehyde-activating enzyme [Hypoxylon fragiforme]|uniref:glutathione-dependent formaldehyde-activating enzyme n=1 Tax=Hypoxylon fragiforme TaxID=63214 RepID=UPI0020C661A8|nr:glutathione-dependent formaldehyde-activating enzyme [Hypoxylon fragiforme]KAI2607283.1 glutathione-dependent formaldehyde-activating enzyme [Hypoxylon fragiforme]
MSEQLKTYRGNCHCAEYVFEVQVPESSKPKECNCSLCYKRGALWLSPKSENLHFVKGDPSTLANYTFGGKTWNHKFCSKCGVELMVVGHITPPQPGEQKEPVIGVNVRAFQHGQGMDAWAVERDFIDGQSFGKPYEPPKFTGPEPKAVVDGGKLYTGGCHCGAVRIAVKSKPFDQITGRWKPIQCNCSICSRHAYAWCYPPKEQVEIEGEDNLEVYLFNNKLFGKVFCKICGVSAYNKLQPITEDQINAMPEDRQGFVRVWLDRIPINLRVINDLNVNDLGLEVCDGYDREPRYVEP